MAAPVNDVYSAASGETIYAGRVPPWPGDWIVAGDSLTDLLYNSSGYRMGFPLTMRPPAVVWNAGVQSETVNMLADRLPNTLAAFPTVPNYLIRMGTNGAGGSGSYQTEFGRLLTILRNGNKRCVFLAIPPKINVGSSTVDSEFIAANAWLAAQCAAEPARFKFIYDSDDLALSSHYNYDPTCFLDGIHMNGRGVYRQAVDMVTGLTEILPDVDCRITDASDVYPANPSSNQWVQNPTMLGSSGVATAGVTGTVVNNLNVEGYGAGTTGVASIVVASAGDTLQVPWQRLNISAVGGSGHAVYFFTDLLNAAVPANESIHTIELVMELRFVNFDTSVLGNIGLRLTSGGGNISWGVNFPMGNNGVVNRQMVLRHNYRRTQGSSNSVVSLSAVNANTMRLWLEIGFLGPQATPLGSVDIRCLSVRGLT